MCITKHLGSYGALMRRAKRYLQALSLYSVPLVFCAKTRYCRLQPPPPPSRPEAEGATSRLYCVSGRLRSMRAFAVNQRWKHEVGRKVTAVSSHSECRKGCNSIIQTLSLNFRNKPRPRVKSPNLRICQGLTAHAASPPSCFPRSKP